MWKLAAKDGLIVGVIVCVAVAVGCLRAAPSTGAVFDSGANVRSRANVEADNDGSIFPPTTKKENFDPCGYPPSWITLICEKVFLHN